jgi:hypothetical protein
MTKKKVEDPVMMTTFAKVGDHTYNVSMTAEDRKVCISRDHVWIGEGRWAGSIVDCPASLDTRVHEELDEAIEVTMDAILEDKTLARQWFQALYGRKPEKTEDIVSSVWDALQ